MERPKINGLRRLASVVLSMRFQLLEAEALSSVQLRSNGIGPEGCQALCGVLRLERPGTSWNVLERALNIFEFALNLRISDLFDSG